MRSKIYGRYMYKNTLLCGCKTLWNKDDYPAKLIITHECKSEKCTRVFQNRKVYTKRLETIVEDPSGEDQNDARKVINDEETYMEKKQ